MSTRHILLIAVTLFSQQSFAAHFEASTQIRYYDDGETTVISPALDVEALVNADRTRISAGVASDILTSASSDVRTYGSRGIDTKITDSRKELALNVETQVSEGTFGLGYIQSDEKDYSSRIVSASSSREFFQKNTIFRFGFSNGQDRVKSSVNAAVNEPLNHQVYSFNWEQVLSKLSVMQVIYDFRVESGFIMSPYRRAKIKDDLGNVKPSLSENHPRTRNRHATAFKYNYFLSSWALSLATTYRFYFDSWQVRSHTLEERFSKDLNKLLSMSLILRYYSQGKASFFEDYYSDGSNPPFRTGNTTLDAHQSYLIGIRPQYKLSENWAIYGKYEFYLQKFEAASDAGQYFNADDDKRLSTKAHVVGLGLSAKF